MRDNRLPLGQILVLLGGMGLLLILVSHPLFVPPQIPSLAVIVKPKGYGYVGNLFRVNADGSQLEQLAADVNTVAPVWSPNGEQIAFMKDRDLWIVDADGLHLRQLTHDVTVSSEPAWSPDGRSIVLIADNNVAVIDLTGATLRRITDQARPEGGQDEYGYGYPSWSPDGKTIAFEGYHRPTANNDIFVVDAACADPNCVGRFSINSPLDEHGYDWSPNSQSIVFGSVRSKTRLFKLYVIDLTDDTTRQLTTDALIDNDPEWSPDGSKIAFDSITQDLSKRFVSVVDIDGNVNWTLPIQSINGITSLEWSPNGRWLAYSVDQELYLRAEDGITESIHFDNAEFLLFDWRP